MIDFRILPMTELRTRPGEILDRVADQGESFLIERNGQRKACLVPLTVFLPDVAPARIAEELEELEKADFAFRTTVTNDREIAIIVPVNTDQDTVDVEIVLPNGYPNACPRVYIHSIDDVKVPHRWADGTLCIFGVMSHWNPGKHGVALTLNLSQRWLKNYSIWRATGAWPATEVSND
jgi:prevent-host-death family protein